MRVEASTGPAVPVGSWETIAGTSRRTVAALEYLAGRADHFGKVTITHRGMATALGWLVDERGRSQAVQRAVKALSDGGAIHVLERRHESGEYVIVIEVDFVHAGAKEHVANGDSISIPDWVSTGPVRRPTEPQRLTEQPHGRRYAELRAFLTLVRRTRLRAHSQR